MEIKYTAKAFSEIWSHYLNGLKIEEDNLIPQDDEFRKSFTKQKEFAINYCKNHLWP